MEKPEKTPLFSMIDDIDANWSNDPTVPKVRFAFSVRRVTFGLATLACIAFLVNWHLRISDIFGFAIATWLTVFCASPLVIGLWLYSKWPAVRRRELAFFAVFFCITSWCIVAWVRQCYDERADWDHNEDVKWSHFESCMREDPAFRNVEIKLWRYHIYYGEGTVPTQADLDRLTLLGIQCGIDRQLDGPFGSSVSIIVQPPPGR